MTDRPNTTAHTAGRICYPAPHHAYRAIISGRRGTYPGSGVTRAQWWPGKGRPSRAHRDLVRRLLLPAPDTRRDYMPVEGP